MSAAADAPRDGAPTAPQDAGSDSSDPVIREIESDPVVVAKTKAEKRAETWAAYKSDFRWATPLLFVLVLAIPGFLWGAWQHVPQGEESMSDITNITFATNQTTVQSAGQPAHLEPGLVVPFEILSVLLLAALIAGIVIALRDHDSEELGGR